MLFGHAILCLGDETCALFVDLTRDRQLDIFLLPLELPFALAQRQLLASCLVELLRLFLDLVFQLGQLLRELPLDFFQRFLFGAPHLLVQTLFVPVAQLSFARRERLLELGPHGFFDLRANGAGQRDLPAAEWTRDRRLGHRSPLPRLGCAAATG